MYKQRFSIGDLVIVNNSNINKVGILISRKVMRGSRVFDVRLENGNILLNVCVDNKSDTTFIDSAKSNAISKKKSIVTNLNSVTNCNLKSTI